MIDDVRVDKRSLANTANAEISGEQLDFTSVGFDIKVNESDINTNGVTYIYACWA